MSSTQQLGLPLLQPAQAQKHVTVNAALVRLDGLVELTLVSRAQAAPRLLLSMVPATAWLLARSTTGAGRTARSLSAPTAAGISPRLAAAGGR